MTTTMQTTKNVATVTAHEPTNGGIGGHKVTCTCGANWTTSLSAAEASAQAFEHLAWHTKAGR